MRIGFMGSPDFSIPTLQGLAQSNHLLAVVYTQPPRPKGRGKKIIPCPVYNKACELNIPVLTPTNFNDNGEIEKLKSYNLDLLVVVAYGIILPQEVLDIPKYGCINGHASLLPRWRGAAPIQRAIQAGDSETGVCVMQMASGLDTGDIISQTKIAIGDNINGGGLHDKLMNLTADEVVKVCNNIDNITHTPQASTGVSYANKLYRTEADIDWGKSAVDIAATIRAFNPFPMCQTTINGRVIKILASEVTTVTTDKPAGTILADNPFFVACGDGSVLNIITLQKPDKKPVSIKDFLNGNKIPVATVLGV